MVQRLTTLKHYGSQHDPDGCLAKEVRWQFAGYVSQLGHLFQETLREQIKENVFSLQAKCENPFFAILRDLNTCDCELSSASRFKQVVTFPMRGKRTLEKIIAKNSFMKSATSLPPLRKSDHLSLFWAIPGNHAIKENKTQAQIL